MNFWGAINLYDDAPKPKLYTVVMYLVITLLLYKQLHDQLLHTLVTTAIKRKSILSIFDFQSETFPTKWPWNTQNCSVQVMGHIRLCTNTSRSGRCPLIQGGVGYQGSHVSHVNFSFESTKMDSADILTKQKVE